MNIKKTANILVFAGSLAWLGVGLLNTNYVQIIAGGFSNIVYIAVGVAGLMNYKELI